ncbi:MULTISPECIES: hypothetical protein, partial [Psychrilyobacter]
LKEWYLEIKSITDKLKNHVDHAPPEIRDRSKPKDAQVEPISTPDSVEVHIPIPPLAVVHEEKEAPAAPQEAPVETEKTV